MAARHHRLGLWITGILLTCVVYLAAVGPVFSLALRHGGLATTFYSRAYAPLHWVCNRSNPVDSAFCWYLGVWGHGVVTNKERLEELARQVP